MGMSVRARRKAERPGEILHAALDEFFRNGYMATRLDDIAAKIDVTKGTIYFYFENKERLFNKVVRHFAPSLTEMEAANVDADTSAVDSLRKYLRYLYSRIVMDDEARKAFHLLASDGRHFPNLLDEYFADIMEPSLAHVRKLLQAGVDSGDFSASPAERFPEIALGPTIILNLWLVVFGDRRPIDQEQYVEAHLELLLRGLLKRNAT